MATDENTCVRAAYAKNIATLAEISVRYLEQTQTEMYDKGSNKQRDVPKVNYEIELQTLHEMVKRTVSSLLTDSQPLVKQTLVESGISKLCVFFGKQKGIIIFEVFGDHCKINNKNSKILCFFADLQLNSLIHKNARF